jgi:hypothetical protein
MHLFRSLLLPLALVMLLSPPAHAQAETPDAGKALQAEAPPNPWLAAGLSVGAPFLLGLASANVGGIAAPIGFGAGHFYAGNHERGAWVSLGGAATFLGGAAIALALPSSDARPRLLLQALQGAALGTLFYGFFAGADAFRTTNERNVALRAGLKQSAGNRELSGAPTD